MKTKLTKAQDEARKKKNRERMAKYRLAKKNKLNSGSGGTISKKESVRKLPVRSEGIDVGTLTIRVVHTVNKVKYGGFTHSELVGMVLSTLVIGAAFYFIV